jgi:hypothetical protein
LCIELVLRSIAFIVIIYFTEGKMEQYVHKCIRAILQEGRRKMPIMVMLRRSFPITIGLLIALFASSCSMYSQATATNPTTPVDRFNAPGNLLISDQFNNRIVEVAPDGHVVWTFGSGNPKLCNPVLAASLASTMLSVWGTA